MLPDAAGEILLAFSRSILDTVMEGFESSETGQSVDVSLTAWVVHEEEILE